MKQTLGVVAMGEGFWDRKEEVQSFLDKIESGTHIYLTAQRRMGKTSLLREVERRLKDRYVCLFVDLEKAMDAPEAIVELGAAIYPLTSLQKKVQGLFSNVLKVVKHTVEDISLGELKVSIRAGLTAGNWKEKGDDLFRILAASKKPVLLMMDETPILVNRILKGDEFRITPERRRNADEFLSWMRSNSLDHQGKIRIVVSGSIGFEPILRQARLSAAINTFTPFELGPWDEAAAIGCLEALAEEYKLSIGKNALQAMVDKLGCCIPDHVQRFFDHVRDHCRRAGKSKADRKDVETVYENEMLTLRTHGDLVHYEERLKLVLGPDRMPMALEMLAEAACNDRLTAQALQKIETGYTFQDAAASSVQTEILNVLEHDGYLRQDRDGYVFVSNLLRDWWKKQYGLFYRGEKGRKRR